MEMNLIKVLSLVPLLIVSIGVVGNLAAFFIFTFNKNMNQMSSMIYLSFVALADTFSLFVWNLDHFFLTNYSFKLENLGVYSCKILSFIQFSSLQLSGLLHAAISIDRYFTIISVPGPFEKRLPFGRPRSALFWSTVLTVSIMIFNLHLLIFNGYWVTGYDFHRANFTDSYHSMRLKKEFAIQIVDFLCFFSEYYDLLPMWNRVHMIVYCWIPFILMMIFNFLLIKRTFYTRQYRIVNTIHTYRRRRLTKSLLFITFGFIVMTLPANIVFGYFYDYFFSFKTGEAVAMITDFFMFFQHSSIFFACYLTNYKFRRIVSNKFSWLKLAKSKQTDSSRKLELTTQVASSRKCTFL